MSVLSKAKHLTHRLDAASRSRSPSQTETQPPAHFGNELPIGMPADEDKYIRPAKVVGGQE